MGNPRRNRGRPGGTGLVFRQEHQGSDFRTGQGVTGRGQCDPRATDLEKVPEWRGRSCIMAGPGVVTTAWMNGWIWWRS